MVLLRTKTGRAALLAVVAILPPLSAAAVPPSVDSLSRSVESLRDGGFTGLGNVVVPAAAASPAPLSAPADPAQDALAGLVALAQGQPQDNGIKETARALGFDLAGDFVEHSFAMVPADDAKRYFAISQLNGETVIVISVYTKATKELRSFRASTAGALQAAALTTKPNGTFVASPVTLPDAEASRIFAAEIELWTRYYRDHFGH